MEQDDYYQVSVTHTHTHTHTLQAKRVQANTHAPDARMLLVAVEVKRLPRLVLSHTQVTLYLSLCVCVCLCV